MGNEKLKAGKKMEERKIRVGIIGLGFWANYGHIPALQALAADFEIIAVAGRKKETAEACAAKFNVMHAFGDELALINHPDIDLVVILAPGPEHYRLAKAAITAGKDVYCEWPLTTKTSDSKELLRLAEEKGVRHIVGLQRRLSPSARYIRHLIKQGYIGKIRSANMIVSVNAFPVRWFPQKAERSHRKPVSILYRHRNGRNNSQRYSKCCDGYRDPGRRRLIFDPNRRQSKVSHWLTF